MNTDVYTKAVLTVIALCLAGILIQNAVTKSFAQQGDQRTVQKVTICDEQGHACVPIYNGGSSYQAGLGVAIVNNH